MLSPSLSLSFPLSPYPSLSPSLPPSLPLSAAFVSRPLAISLSLLLWKQHCSMGAQMNVHFVCVSEVTDRKYSSRVKPLHACQVMSVNLVIPHARFRFLYFFVRETRLRMTKACVLSNRLSWV